MHLRLDAPSNPGCGDNERLFIFDGPRSVIAVATAASVVRPPQYSRAMFKSLFTPLKARFEQSRSEPPPVPALLPSSAASIASFASTASQTTIKAGGPESPGPEDFARDELIESMRQGVEDVKGTQDVRERLRVSDVLGG